MSYQISISLFLYLLNGDNATYLLGWLDGLSDTSQKAFSTAPGSQLKLSKGELSLLVTLCRRPKSR